MSETRLSASRATRVPCSRKRQPWSQPRSLSALPCSWIPPPPVSCRGCSRSHATLALPRAAAANSRARPGNFGHMPGVEAAIHADRFIKSTIAAASPRCRRYRATSLSQAAPPTIASKTTTSHTNPSLSSLVPPSHSDSPARANGRFAKH
jgi:hypothetical protein